MSNQSTGNSEETRLIFDSVVPVVTWEENDNDTLFITDNWLPTGTITETWKFDIETQTWYKIPNPICETLDYTIIDDTRPISRWADAGLRIKWESNITLTPSNVVGAIVTTDQAFFEMPNGDKIPLKVTVERRTTGPWNIFIGANWGMSNTPWSADYQITVEILPDCFGNTFDGALMSIIPTSVWGGEALIFSQPYPIEEYIRWPWAPALTLPYVWFWNNNNNNNTSALWFWVSDVISFRANWQNRISSNISVWLRTIPWYKEYDVCEILDFSKDYTDRAIENIQDQDTFGTVANNTWVNFTTTNGADVDPWEDFIQMPDWTTWATQKCPEEMTRAQLIALRNTGNLSKDCHYVITDPEPNGTLLLEKVLIHAVDENTLSGCYLKTAHDNIAWQGFYDIDSNDVLEVTDNLENHVKENASIVSFPFGVATVNDNNVDGGILSYTAGTVTNCVIESGGRINMTSGTVVNTKVWQLSTLNMIAWILRETNIGQDSDITIRNADNYENTIGNSVVFNQVGTGYIRYSTFEGTTTWTNWDTNLSNVKSYVWTTNTTGSSGTISNSQFTRHLGNNLQNITSLTITDCSFSGYVQLSANNAARLYLYRSNFTSGARILVSNGSRIDASYTTVSDYGYLQSTQAWGFLRANYCNVSSLWYITNITTNTNYAERCDVSSQANIRFDWNAANCRVYYTDVHSGSVVYHTGNSTSCYIYYCSAESSGQIYTTDSTNARIYYSNADARGRIISSGNTTIHYIYYCNATSNGLIYEINNTGSVRMYSVNSSSQSIARVQNSTSAWNLYYSDFDSYFYAYITFTTTGTRSGYFGKWRRTETVTNPTKQVPVLSSAYFTNL